MPKLRMGMVGGGPGSFIGRIHRIAAQLDGEVELVCGAFSSDARKSAETGAALHLAPERAYASYGQMMDSESRLPAGQRMEFIAIVTPNDLHCAPALLALEHGFHVIVDKPLCRTLEEARELEGAVARSGLVLALTQTYCGYPMVKEARDLIASGRLGALRKVFVEYPQGWLATDLESSGHKQAQWRTDPRRSGSGGAVGDIGTHAAQLAEYVTGLRITHVCAMLETFIEGRRLDDDSSMLLRFERGASGVLLATQVAAGEENALAIRVYGNRGGLEWRQQEPNTLLLRPLDGPPQLLRAGTAWLGQAAQRNARTPAGHPEGYLEAFANLYLEFARAVRAYQCKGHWISREFDIPTVADGVRGMRFIDAVVRSARSTQKWTELA